MSDLYRPEVSRAKSFAWLGPVQYKAARSFRIFSALAICFLISIIALAIFGEVSRKATLPGVLLPRDGVINAIAQQPSIVDEIFVREGETVRQGQVIARLKSERRVGGGDLSEISVLAIDEQRRRLASERSLAQQQHEQRRVKLERRLTKLREQGTQLESELSTMAQRVEISRSTYGKYEELARTGFTSIQQLQALKQESLDLQSKEVAARRALTALDSEREMAEGELAEANLNIQIAVSQIDRNLAALHQTREEAEFKGQTAVVSPAAGQVTAVTVKAGQFVQAGQNLVAVVPRTKEHSGGALVASLYSPSRFAGFVEAGQTVYLRLAAYPYRKFGMVKGQVRAISATPLPAVDLPAGQSEALQAAARSPEPLYRIDVEIERESIQAYGRQIALRPGLSLEADVIQDRRSIIEWLLEPLLSNTGLAKILGGGEG